MLDVTGTGPWSIDFTIDGVATTVNSAVTPFSLGTAEGDYILTTIFDANCNDVAVGNQSIIIDPAPNVFAGLDFINCENDPIVLSGTGAQSYIWDNGVIDGVAFTPTSTITYNVVGTDANGCTNSDDIIVTFEALPAVAFVSDGSALTVDFYFSDELTCTAQLTDISPELPTLTAVSSGGTYCPGTLVADIIVDVTGNGPWSVDYTIDGVPFNTVGATSNINLGNAPGVYVMTNVNDAGCTNVANGTETIIIPPNPTIVSLTAGRASNVTIISS